MGGLSDSPEKLCSGESGFDRDLGRLIHNLKYDNDGFFYQSFLRTGDLNTFLIILSLTSDLVQTTGLISVPSKP